MFDIKSLVFVTLSSVSYCLAINKDNNDSLTNILTNYDDNSFCNDVCNRPVKFKYYSLSSEDLKSIDEFECGIECDCKDGSENKLLNYIKNKKENCSVICSVNPSLTMLILENEEGLFNDTYSICKCSQYLNSNNSSIVKRDLDDYDSSDAHENDSDENLLLDSFVKANSNKVENIEKRTLGDRIKSKDDEDKKVNRSVKTDNPPPAAPPKSEPAKPPVLPPAPKPEENKKTSSSSVAPTPTPKSEEKNKVSSSTIVSTPTPKPENDKKITSTTVSLVSTTKLEENKKPTSSVVVTKTSESKESVASASTQKSEENKKVNSSTTNSFITTATTSIATTETVKQNKAPSIPADKQCLNLCKIFKNANKIVGYTKYSNDRHKINPECICPQDDKVKEAVKYVEPSYDMCNEQCSYMFYMYNIEYEYKGINNSERSTLCKCKNYKEDNKNTITDNKTQTTNTTNVTTTKESKNNVSVTKEPTNRNDITKTISNNIMETNSYISTKQIITSKQNPKTEEIKSTQSTKIVISESIKTSDYISSKQIITTKKHSKAEETTILNKEVVDITSNTKPEKTKVDITTSGAVTTTVIPVTKETSVINVIETDDKNEVENITTEEKIVATKVKAKPKETISVNSLKPNETTEKTSIIVVSQTDKTAKLSPSTSSSTIKFLPTGNVINKISTKTITVASTTVTVETTHYESTTTITIYADRKNVPTDAIFHGINKVNVASIKFKDP
ncbi:hypothetical protein HDU92_008470 [Lobulomyces angularis]|nr:hypothetical protein HDU92_008470 [Lobulomyces angularis]